MFDLAPYSGLNFPTEIHPFAHDLFHSNVHDTKEIFPRIPDRPPRSNAGFVTIRRNWTSRDALILFTFRVPTVWTMLPIKTIALELSINKRIIYASCMIRATKNHRNMGIVNPIGPPLVVAIGHV